VLVCGFGDLRWWLVVYGVRFGRLGLLGVSCVYIGYLIAMFCLCVFLVCFGVWFYCIARVLRIRLKFGGCLFACGVIVLR